MIKKTWSYFSFAGIKESYTPSEAKRFMLSNQFLVIATFFTLFYGVFFESYGYRKATYVEIVLALAYFFIWLIAKESYNKLSKFLFLLVVNFHVYFMSLIFGEQSQLYLLYGPVAIASVVLYEFKQKEYIFLFSLIHLSFNSP